MPTPPRVASARDRCAIDEPLPDPRNALRRSRRRSGFPQLHDGPEAARRARLGALRRTRDRPRPSDGSRVVSGRRTEGSPYAVGNAQKARVPGSAENVRDQQQDTDEGPTRKRTAESPVLGHGRCRDRGVSPHQPRLFELRERLVAKLGAHEHELGTEDRPCRFDRHQLRVRVRGARPFPALEWGAGGEEVPCGLASGARPPVLTILRRTSMSCTAELSAQLRGTRR